MDTPIESKASGWMIMWCIATSEEPVTVKETAEYLGSSESNVSKQLNRGWRSGLLVRRKRPSRVGKSGTAPYEYEIAAREEESESE